MAAAIAMEAQKTVFGHTASEVLAKIAFDESGQRPFLFLTVGQKALELFGDDLI
jgi:hypothetical protein